MLYGTVYGDVAGSAYEFHPVKDDNFLLYQRNMLVLQMIL